MIEREEVAIVHLYLAFREALLIGNVRDVLGGRMRRGMIGLGDGGAHDGGREVGTRGFGALGVGGREGGRLGCVFVLSIVMCIFGNKKYVGFLI